MGVHQSNLSFDKYFETPIVRTQESVTIRVILQSSCFNNKDEEIVSATVTLGPEKLEIKTHKKGETPEEKADYEWTPKTHMRTFEEAGDPMSKSLAKTARGQGIGVIIVPEISVYLKLAYDPTSEKGVGPSAYGDWAITRKNYTEMHEDLDNGFDVLMVSNGKQFESLCEEKDERDERKTIIHRSDSKYASYDPKKRRAADISESEGSDSDDDSYRRIAKQICISDAIRVMMQEASREHESAPSIVLNIHVIDTSVATPERPIAPEDDVDREEVRRLWIKKINECPEDKWDADEYMSNFTMECWPAGNVPLEQYIVSDPPTTKEDLKRLIQRLVF